MIFSDEEKKALDQHAVILIGNNHFYSLNLDRRYCNLKYSKPLFFKSDISFIRSDCWQKMLLEVVKLYCEKASIDQNKLHIIKFDWTIREIFSGICFSKQYWKKISDEAGYLYVNFDSIHLYFILMDFLTFLGVKKEDIEFVVALSPANEPKDIYDIFYKKNMSELMAYLEHEKKFNEEKRANFIHWLNGIDKILNEIAPSKKSLITIEDPLDLNTIASRLSERAKLIAIEKQKSFLFVLKTVVDFKKRLINIG